MNTALVWMLIFTGGQGFPIIPNLPSEAACKEVYQKLYKGNWVRPVLAGKDHECISYHVAVPIQSIHESWRK